MLYLTNYVFVQLHPSDRNFFLFFRLRQASCCLGRSMPCFTEIFAAFCVCSIPITFGYLHLHSLIPSSHPSHFLAITSTCIIAGRFIILGLCVSVIVLASVFPLYPSNSDIRFLQLYLSCTLDLIYSSGASMGLQECP
ncbi:hypothetical protein BOTBODRAFT_366162 [Botryobasidium botryosum FD-172 SS1]|uniref:Uncharacterized protein n=1 Tax=Botryobasidium botryosum (strain FD-172 SS1) TaxID=930990 RepID=A0A067MDS2_BOTB1|nr:hypothetical protein BOTBODRAFT_366162 [Botryobasidium botryosum FD-172 SS1]